MAFSEEERNRVIELFHRIEGNKAHAYAAPTYKDSPYLRELAQIVMRHTESDSETLEDAIPALRYLAECYDQMCRAGMSVKFYAQQLQAHMQLKKLKAYDAEATEQFEGCFCSAVKARNYYEPDACADLVAIVSGGLPEQRISELLCSAQKNRRSFIKKDPVEKTEEYLAVIDGVEQEIAENITMDFCLEYWRLKAKYLAKHSIRWRSPAQLNPGVLFD